MPTLAVPLRQMCNTSAIAIWALMFIVMSVLGGIGAFSFHLWRCARHQLEPYEQLIEEDLSQYE